jgi:hypothetical protein
MPKKRKPTRRDLLVVIGRLQHLIGQSKNCYFDDRDPNRADSVVKPLEEAFNICIEATSQDLPITSNFGPWSGK